MSHSIANSDIVSWAKSYDGPRFHGCFCDPPYELGFMGKKWDSTGVAFQPETWAAVSNCLHPGAYLLAFGGTRTFHRLACAIEDAGFEIRDTLMWVYGSGFPKSLDVSKAIDKDAGAEREVVGEYVARGFSDVSPTDDGRNQWAAGEVSDKTATRTIPSTDQAKQWNGYGTALKPAYEPIILARKPIEGTVAANVLKYGCGGINIDGCRVGTEPRTYNGGGASQIKLKNHGRGDTGIGMMDGRGKNLVFSATGRFPANLIHDGSQQVLDLFPKTNPSKAAARGGTNPNPMDWGNERSDGCVVKGHDDNGGSAARYFYCAKASKKERDEGLDNQPIHSAADCVDRQPDSAGMQSPRAGAGRTSDRHNHHPTVKPISLCTYLAKLILPPTTDNRILVPFSGSGSEIIGCYLAGWSFIQGIEKEAEYVELATHRLNHWANENPR